MPMSISQQRHQRPPDDTSNVKDPQNIKIVTQSQICSLVISFHYDVYNFWKCYRLTCLDLVVFAGRIMHEQPFRPVRSQYFHLTRKQADKIFQKLALFFACFAAGGLGRVACVAAGESLIQHCLLRSISFPSQNIRSLGARFAHFGPLVIFPLTPIFGSSQIGPWTIGPRTIGLRTVGPRGPIQLGQMSTFWGLGPRPNLPRTQYFYPK